MVLAVVFTGAVVFTVVLAVAFSVTFSGAISRTVSVAFSRMLLHGRFPWGRSAIFHFVRFVFYIRRPSAIVIDDYRTSAIRVIVAVHGGQPARADPVSVIDVNVFGSAYVVIRIDIGQIIIFYARGCGRGPFGRRSHMHVY